jgi:hypothetical protein
LCSKLNKSVPPRTDKGLALIMFSCALAKDNDKTATAVKIIFFILFLFKIKLQIYKNILTYYFL